MSLFHEFGQRRNCDDATVTRGRIGDRLQHGGADARFNGIGGDRQICGGHIGAPPQRLARFLERGLAPLDGRGNPVHRNALGLPLGNLALEQRDRNAGLARMRNGRINPLCLRKGRVGSHQRDYEGDGKYDFGSPSHKKPLSRV
jgi:hypothetical protein